MSKKIIKNKTLYFIGIKGVGMTMLAQFLAKQGNKILGSDIVDTFLTDKVLASAKIKVLSPFAPKNIPPKIDLIIYSSAYNSKNNLELKFIANHPEIFKSVRLLSYAQALGEIFNQYQGIAVCGSHGKTSTSASLAYVLWRAKKNPNALIGSRVPQLKGSSLKGSASYLIAEADEYQNKLQYFKPQGVVLNNIDYDHPDFFKTKAAYIKVFIDFIKKIPATGFLVLNDHDSVSRGIKKYCRAKVITYNLAEDSSAINSDYSAYDLKIKNGQQIFKVNYQQGSLGQFKINLWGEHNVLNSLAVLATARQLRVPLVLIKKYLASFKGTERRSQFLGFYKGARIIDDYAHHPTEIKATLKSLRARYQHKNLITVFHPHTFTRTKALFTDFSKSFIATDELIVLDIYSSAREKSGGVSSYKLVKAINKFNKSKSSKQKVKYIATVPQAIIYLRGKLKPSDVLVLMGAGDVFRVAQALLK